MVKTEKINNIIEIFISVIPHEIKQVMSPILSYSANFGDATLDSYEKLEYQISGKTPCCS